VDVERRHPDRLLQALGQRIRELRTGQGYSQEGFADKCGVHRTFMGTIERGESNLSFQNIARVATTLGIPLSALFVDLEARTGILAGQSAKTKLAKPRDTIRLRKPASERRHKSS
jgi:transcriptional regulator with XRE-family HTH domain